VVICGGGDRRRRRRDRSLSSSSSSIVVDDCDDSGNQWVWWQLVFVAVVVLGPLWSLVVYLVGSLVLRWGGLGGDFVTRLVCHSSLCC